ncbi:hypothetical protein Q9R38_26165 [Priestia aryabhattai]|uniref:hypothetical protein n=1 Tax=Priestia aryabhattai TaxID=412384 RepID=UPI00288169C3|nr:hypothetical protein [Priestia aryabhattai]MDT0150030.1 hypothetical protein [Priestia aryabhattai]MDT0155600.1 hypothetical protein [Priestia aryabhattai]
MKTFLAVVGAIVLVAVLLVLELAAWGLLTLLAMKGIDLISVHTGHGLVFPKDKFMLIWGGVTFVLFIGKRLFG